MKRRSRLPPQYRTPDYRTTQAGGALALSIIALVIALMAYYGIH